MMAILFLGILFVPAILGVSLAICCGEVSQKNA